MLHKPDNGLFYGERGECERPFQETKFFTHKGDYEEKSVNTIFYDNDRRQACVKSAFRLDLYITVTKLHVKSRRKIRLFF